VTLKKEVVDKILFFTFAELKQWIKKRLHGQDEYFPLYLGDEPNFSEFLIDTFHHIEEEKFRDNFIEILGKLTGDLLKLTRKEIENSRNYIIELLKLCGNIRQFANKDHLLEIAVIGKFKGINVDEETDLHADLLTTLAAYKIVGTYEFWIKQLRDDSDRYYANPAFYALIDNLDRLFKHIDIFIDKFQGDIELEWGIEALINEYGKKEIVKRFMRLNSKLSIDQKKAVNHAFIEIDENPVYKVDTAGDKEFQYTPAPPQLQYVRAPTPGYDALKNLKESSAEIFKLMGFEVEINHKIADRTIDLFAKRKKSFTPSYECWICRCDNTNRKVSKKTVNDFYAVGEPVKKEMQKQTCENCQSMIISGKDFNKTAIEAAKTQKIVLKTYNQLLSDLNTFYSRQKPLILDLAALITH
jgi:hypothetical protein